ncbi:NAD(P)-binding domain-containing protein [Nostoc sp. DedVER01b]|uniref:NAD(P)-binding domain-containing protein n=1 Tax=Nostoc sp. DedVER01b TaxID=3075404 RepID=UPI002AD1E917|nr:MULTISPECIES: NAD(P)-binding domain-containing protein [unclassified Nostoc]MDZ7989825.1 NAD(P)-binding domain-containing protein [Nostoc sp. DedVER02]MDZ8114450.1 NAD(P)-binding domain-containing protein [Nostoc sp. DedVER01b]
MTTTTDLDFAAREALRLLGPDPENWVSDRSGIDHNVTIVGGSGSGSTFAFALRRAGIGRVTVIDEAEDEAHAGVWLTRARMKKLRTPKNLPGPELGIPALSFQAWYEARHGVEAYAAIDRIPRVAWAEYLSWYRHFLGIPVRYQTKLVRIEPDADFFRLHLEVNGVAQVETTRKIIFANGVAGTGGPNIPPVLASLPRTLYTHTANKIDFNNLRGKTVAVLGAAASAFDAAGVALESGAKAVHLFVRRSAIASLPVNRLRGYPGAYYNYPQLSDASRWFQAWRFNQVGSTPPPDAIERVIAFSNFHLHLSAPWKSAHNQGDRIVAQVNDDVFEFDFAIAGTGYFVDPTKRPELAEFAHHIALWRDRYEAPAEQRDDQLSTYPYLGSAHEYQEKVPGNAPYLKDIHVFNPAGFVSFGLPIGDVPSIRRDVPAIVTRISHDLFFADWSLHEARITNGNISPDFDTSLYADAVWKQQTKVAVS